MGATKGRVPALAGNVILDVCALLPGGGRFNAFEILATESLVEEDGASFEVLSDVEFGVCDEAGPVSSVTAAGLRFRVGLLCDVGWGLVSAVDGASAEPSRTPSIVGDWESFDEYPLRTSTATVSPFRTALPELAFQLDKTKSPSSGKRMTSYEGAGDFFVSYPSLFPELPSWLRSFIVS
jgi:hypothetical protein